MTTRIACLVPFCGRTRIDPGDGMEWICQLHWSLVDRELRRLYAAARRRLRKYRDRRSAKLAAWLWRRCARQGAERAGGIA